MNRSPDSLIPFLEDREGWTFGYGPAPRTHDCARFFAAGIEAVTGFDPLAAFGAAWSTERQARRVLAKHGGMAAAVDQVMRVVEPARALRGDGGLTDDNTLVLIEGQTVIGLSPERGLIRLPRAALTRAWTV